MKRFLVTYQSMVSAAEQMAAASPEQAQEGITLWMQWADRAGPAIVDLGAPLGRAVSFAAPHLRAAATSSMAGYSVLQATSEDDLARMLEGHPHFRAPSASIVVQEILSLPGM